MTLFVLCDRLRSRTQHLRGQPCSQPSRTSCGWVDTLPMQWTVPVQTAAGPGRMLEKRSTCELEADACVEHVAQSRQGAPRLFNLPVPA